MLPLPSRCVYVCVYVCVCPDTSALIQRFSEGLGWANLEVKLQLLPRQIDRGARRKGKPKQDSKDNDGVDETDQQGGADSSEGEAPAECAWESVAPSGTLSGI